MKLTTHLRVAPSLRMRGAIRPLPQLRQLSFNYVHMYIISPLSVVQQTDAGVQTLGLNM
jgi:hypothetical protein